MLLTFSKPDFKTLIKDGVKVHTIRDDKHNRWKVGTKIHFWLGNPRNTKAKLKPHQFALGEVERVENITIFFKDSFYPYDKVHIGEDIVLQSPSELDALAINDGFENFEQMRSYFYFEANPYLGKIIFWKRLKENNFKI